MQPLKINENETYLKRFKNNSLNPILSPFTESCESFIDNIIGFTCN